MRAPESEQQGEDNNDEDWLVIDAKAAPHQREESHFEIWHENWDAWQTFLACGTQWAVGLQGATGLNYTALESVMRMRCIPPEQQPEIFEKVRLIETGVLKAFAKQRAQEQAKQKAQPRS